MMTERGLLIVLSGPSGVGKELFGKLFLKIRKQVLIILFP